MECHYNKFNIRDAVYVNWRSLFLRAKLDVIDGFFSVWFGLNCSWCFVCLAAACEPSSPVALLLGSVAFSGPSSTTWSRYKPCTAFSSVLRSAPGPYRGCPPGVCRLWWGTPGCRRWMILRWTRPCPLCYRGKDLSSDHNPRLKDASVITLYDSSSMCYNNDTRPLCSPTTHVINWINSKHVGQ